MKNYKYINPPALKIIKVSILSEENKMPQKTYLKGYKQWRTLKYIKASGEKGRTRTEVVKFLFDISNGKDSYNPISDRGYWSTNIWNIIFSWCDQEGRKYTISEAGKEKIKLLDKKFKNLEVDAYI